MCGVQRVVVLQLRVAVGLKRMTKAVKELTQGLHNLEKYYA